MNKNVIRLLHVHHSRPQRPRSFWSAPKNRDLWVDLWRPILVLNKRIAASGEEKVQRGARLSGTCNALFTSRRGDRIGALDFRSEGRWLERVLSLMGSDVVFFEDKKRYSTLSLFAQVHKWVTAIIMPGITLRRAAIYSISSISSNSLHSTESGVKYHRPDGPLGW